MFPNLLFKNNIFMFCSPEQYKEFKLVINLICFDKPHMGVEVLGKTSTGRSTTIGKLIDCCNRIDNLPIEKLENDLPVSIQIL